MRHKARRETRGGSVATTLAVAWSKLHLLAVAIASGPRGHVVFRSNRVRTAKRRPRRSHIICGYDYRRNLVCCPGRLVLVSVRQLLRRLPPGLSRGIGRPAEGSVLTRTFAVKSRLAISQRGDGKIKEPGCCSSRYVAVVAARYVHEIERDHQFRRRARTYRIVRGVSDQNRYQSRAASDHVAQGATAPRRTSDTRCACRAQR